jgi:hypothetical protein
MATIAEAVDHLVIRMNIEPWECDLLSDEEIESLYSYTVSEDGQIELIAPDGTVFQATLTKKES